MASRSIDLSLLQIAQNKTTSRETRCCLMTATPPLPSEFLSSSESQSFFFLIREFVVERMSSSGVSRVGDVNHGNNRTPFPSDLRSHNYSTRRVGLLFLLRGPRLENY